MTRAGTTQGRAVPPRRATPGRGARQTPRSARGARAHAVRARARRGETGEQDRFGLLLVVLVVTYLLSAFTSGVWVSALQVVLVVTVALLAVRTGHMPRRAGHAAVAGAVGGSAAAVTLALVYRADVGVGLANAWTALVLLFAVVLIVRRVLSHSVVTLQSIFGALSAYVIIGLMFAAVYGSMNRLGGPFFGAGQPANVNTLQYFSFTTLTTLGYGDFTAAADGGRAVAVMEALLGQVFLATLVARLVSAFRGPGGDRRPGSRQGRPRPPAAGKPGTPAQFRRRSPAKPSPASTWSTRISSQARGRRPAGR